MTCNYITHGNFIFTENIRRRLQGLDQHCMTTLQNAYRPGTQRNYRCRANGYFRFCEFYQLPPYPATEWQLIRYARYLANGVTSYDTVKGYLSTIKRLHEIGGFQFPSETHLLKQELKAIRRELITAIKKAVPITPQILLQIYSVIKLKDIVDVVTYAGLVIGFCLFLRKSNLVPDTQDGFNPAEQLTRGDITFRGPLTLVDIKWSKTLQYRQRELRLPLLQARNKQICPIYWLTYIFNKLPARRDQPLLCYPKNGKMVPVTYDLMSSKLKTWVQQAGYSPEGFTLHGLRRGGTNHCMTIGLSGSDVKLMGDWASDAYMTYIDLTLDRRVTNMVRFVEEMDKMIDDCDVNEQDELWSL